MIFFMKCGHDTMSLTVFRGISKSIPNHIHLAFRRSNSRVVEFLQCTLQTHLNAATEHGFSIAATMGNSTLSFITLLCKQG